MQTQQAGPVKAPTTLPARQDAPIEVLDDELDLTKGPEFAGETPEPHAFYSKYKALAISAWKGRRVVIDGEHKRVDELVIEFTPQADGYGLYVTRNKWVIDFLTKRAAKEGDVLLPEQYNDKIIPAEEKIRQLKESGRRQIEENNRLLAMLNEKTAPR
jgi:hypothetical protein